MSEQLQPYDKFYRCVRIIAKAWKGKEGYEMDADRAMGMIDDMIAEGKFMWDENKLADELADFVAEEKEEILRKLETKEKPQEKMPLFPGTRNIFFPLILALVLIGIILFAVEKCGNKIF